VHSKRLSGAEKEIRNILVYGIWRTGLLKTEQIDNQFGLSFSGVSHAIKSVKLNLTKRRLLQTNFEQLNSLFKL
jgi:hypothetical protein